MFPLTEPVVVPGTETDETPTLSVATTVKVTVWLWAEVFNSTVVSSAVKLLIAGLWSSLFVTLISISSVILLPAVSVTVAVKVSPVVPKL